MTLQQQQATAPNARARARARARGGAGSDPGPAEETNEQKVAQLYRAIVMRRPPDFVRKQASGRSNSNSNSNGNSRIPGLTWLQGAEARNLDGVDHDLGLNREVRLPVAYPSFKDKMIETARLWFTQRVVKAHRCSAQEIGHGLYGTAYLVTGSGRAADWRHVATHLLRRGKNRTLASRAAGAVMLAGHTVSSASSPAPRPAAPPDPYNIVVKLQACKTAHKEAQAVKEELVFRHLSRFRCRFGAAPHLVLRGWDSFPRFLFGCTVELRVSRRSRSRSRSLQSAAATQAQAQQTQQTTQQAHALKDVPPTPIGRYRLSGMTYIAQPLLLDEFLKRYYTLTPLQYAWLERAFVTMWLAGFTHMDMHFGNIVLTYERTGGLEMRGGPAWGYKPYIIDFGRARRLPDDMRAYVESAWRDGWSTQRVDFMPPGADSVVVDLAFNPPSNLRSVPFEDRVLRELRRAFNISPDAVLRARLLLYGPSDAPPS